MRIKRWFVTTMAAVAVAHAAAQVPADLAPRLRAIGPVLNPQMIQETFDLYLKRVADSAPGVSITQDLAYGVDERHRLDIFAQATPAAKPMPVVLFVPGGGFVGGAKNRAGVPFYQNVAVFFARNGVLGVTMNYRLAPKHPWPAGGEDVAAAIQWLRKNIAQYGGDPERIFLFGQSAGATHVAHYVFDKRVQPADGKDGVLGAVLQSPVLDPAGAPPGPNIAAYFGAAETWGDKGLLAKVGSSKLPVFLAYAELDPKHFRDQAALLRSALCARDGGRCPRTADLAGHNHISEIAHLGSTDDVAFGRELLEFIRVGR